MITKILCTMYAYFKFGGAGSSSSSNGQSRVLGRNYTARRELGSVAGEHQLKLQFCSVRAKKNTNYKWHIQPGLVLIRTLLVWCQLVDCKVPSTNVKLLWFNWVTMTAAHFISVYNLELCICLILTLTYMTYMYTRSYNAIFCSHTMVYVQRLL